MNWAQKLYRNFKLRGANGLPSLPKLLPVLNTVMLHKWNRYMVMKSALILFGIVPVFGYFRRAYVKQKFYKQLQGEIQMKEVQLKESLAKFNISIPSDMDYMVVFSYSTLNSHDPELTRQDEEACRKVYDLHEQGQNSRVGKQEIKWVFLGSEAMCAALKETGKDIQFLEEHKMKREEKVYLVGRSGEQEKVLMQWELGVPMSAISKCISKDKQKKYLQSVNF